MLCYVYPKLRKDSSITSQEIANYISVELAVALSVDILLADDSMESLVPGDSLDLKGYHNKTTHKTLQWILKLSFKENDCPFGIVNHIDRQITRSYTCIEKFILVISRIATT